MQHSARPSAPLLEGDLGRKAGAVIDEIAEAVLPLLTGPDPHTRVRRAPWEAALLYGYLAQARGEERWLSSLDTALDQTVVRLSETITEAALYGGFAGAGWVVQHVTQGADAAAIDDANAEIDSAIIELIQQSPWQGDYDLISGLVGYGVYLLERLPRARAQEGLTLLLDRFEELAERRPDGTGITWHTPPELLIDWQRERAPGGYYNLGVAHGVPGIVFLLVELIAADIAAPRARVLLDGALRWMRAQRRDGQDGKPGYQFPAWVATEPSWNPRMAWCYGDLGIGVTWLHAARRLGDRAWEDEARAILASCLGRPASQAGVVDAGLCHGAAGLGHIYHRIYLTTGDGAFAEAARFWFAETLGLQKPGSGIVGYQALIGTRLGSDTGWLDDSGFLTGVVGIALGLLAATTTTEPAWDRLMLLSGVPLV